jgi:hypothetical protein
MRFLTRSIIITTGRRKMMEGLGRMGMSGMERMGIGMERLNIMRGMKNSMQKRKRRKQRRLQMRQQQKILLK